MSNYLAPKSRRGATPQSEPIRGTVENSAGGHSFEVNDWTKLERFLVLGAEGGIYYAGQNELVRENAKAVERCIQADGARTVATIVAVSDAGRAPKNDQALYALAMALKLGDVDTRRLAGVAVAKVARTGTHLFQLAEFVQAFGGWGRITRRAFADWYLARSVDDVAFQAVKYRQRDGWTHRDIMRLAHPYTADAARGVLFNWMCGRTGDALQMALPTIVQAFLETQRPTNDARSIAHLILKHGLPREAVPTEVLNSPLVWCALLGRMPLGAMVRNLGKMTSIGLLPPLGSDTNDVAAKLQDGDALRKARIHPLALLIAQKVYAAGHGDKGSLSWSPVGQITDALDAGFYKAFQAVDPTGKRIMLALDVSGSMGQSMIAGTSITPREGSAAMALVTAATEPRHMIVGFTSGAPGEWKGGRSQHRHYPANISEVPISPRMRLREAVEVVSRLPFGGTDCALPMLYAMDRGIAVDAFVIYTDSETWAGDIHPVEALRKYRAKSGIPAKLVVVGMVGNKFSIADPSDGGMLDVVGFDAAAPAVISDFIRG